MATKAVLRPSIIKYSVPEDLSQEHYDRLIQAVGDWFSRIRKTQEPVALAKRNIDCCLAGVKPSDGQPWEQAATMSLAKRVRIACRYDMELWKPLIAGDEKRRLKKIADRQTARAKRAAAKQDANYPEAYRTETPADVASYGDDPLVFFTYAELQDRTQMREAYLQQFPQLNNVAALPKLEQLLDLVLLQKRLRFRNAKQDKNTKVTERQMADMIRQVVELEKALGIDPQTLAKTQRDKEGGDVGEMIRRFEGLGDWRKLRERWFAEELLLLFKAYHTPSPRTNTGGFQLDEVALYGLTKTRLVTCPHCGHKNWAGLKIEEIEAWLVEHEYLVPAGAATPIPVQVAADGDLIDVLDD